MFMKDEVGLKEELKQELLTTKVLAFVLLEIMNVRFVFFLTLNIFEFFINFLFITIEKLIQIKKRIL